MDLQSQVNDLVLARKIAREARLDPASPYAGKYVGILDGSVIVIANSPEEGLRELRKIAPDPSRGMLVDTSADYEAVHEVWTA